ncbi:hypothetical protein L9F63_026917, partial [Diploptera punctata]
MDAEPPTVIDIKIEPEEIKVEVQEDIEQCNVKQEMFETHYIPCFEEEREEEKKVILSHQMTRRSVYRRRGRWTSVVN